ncbi:HNH endonuclease [Deinococcus misasensis]|uniref:HNH endonuclease n=1 Tax=Deinococcus misasensis TaxID=392413 RepID=UPI0006918BC2|nr:HNH endonuclease domain-containing protein [Deinococcus misasensis]
MNARRTLAFLLRQESKTNTYKFALVRALNDLALGYCALRVPEPYIAIPLRKIAELWLSYYWAFCDPQNPVLQGPVTVRDGVVRQDISFRKSLTDLRARVESAGLLGSDPSGGHLVHQMVQFDPQHSAVGLGMLYQRAIKDIMVAVRKPIEFSGAGKSHALFLKPARLQELTQVTPFPESHPLEVCVPVPAEIWSELQENSVLIGALTLQEWAKFVGDLRSEPSSTGDAFNLLTLTPTERTSLSYERNQLRVLMLEGMLTRCPWSRKPLKPDDFDVDHLIPVSILPINEWWNLLPADPQFNRHVKRARMVDAEDRALVESRLRHLFHAYREVDSLGGQVQRDALKRFGLSAWDSDRLASEVTHMSLQVADFRQAERFRVMV